MHLIGFLPLSKWCEAMEAATNLGLPWRLLREKLAHSDFDTNSSDVQYNLTLEMLNTDMIVSAMVVVQRIRWKISQNSTKHCFLNLCFPYQIM